MDKLIAAIGTIVILILTLFISWGITTGMIYLLALLIGIKFSIKIATAVWLGLCLIKTIF